MNDYIVFFIGLTVIFPSVPIKIHDKIPFKKPSISSSLDPHL